MSRHNIGSILSEGLNFVSKTATATLTADEINHSLITATHASVAIALTVPAAATEYEGYSFIVASGGAAAVTVVVSAGFGGAGASADTVTLAQGDACMLICDGTNWYVISETSVG
jgi:hypothetical protein